VRHVTLAFSAARDDVTCVVVLGARGDVALRERLVLGTAGPAAADASERLRAWLGALQPTVVALPQAAPRAMMEAIEEARREFGGGFGIAEVPLARAADPCAEAEQRARAAQLQHVARASWMPEPGEALSALVAMARTGVLAGHIVASVFRVATGFGLAVALGIPLGLALGSFAWLHHTANAVIQLLRPISPIAWLPVATLALGGGDLAAIFLIFLAAFFPVAVSTAAAVATVDLKYRRSAANFGVRGVDFARRVLVPAALPSILTGVRIAVGVAWLVVVAAEMLGVESGLGYLVLDARNQLRYDRVVAAMIVIGLIGLSIDLVVRRFERGALERRGLRSR
jgi:NitT/TauT family transport system permease protein